MDNKMIILSWLPCLSPNVIGTDALCSELTRSGFSNNPRGPPRYSTFSLEEIDGCVTRRQRSNDPVFGQHVSCRERTDPKDYYLICTVTDNGCLRTTVFQKVDLPTQDALDRFTDAHTGSRHSRTTSIDECRAGDSLLRRSHDGFRPRWVSPLDCRTRLLAMWLSERRPELNSLVPKYQTRHSHTFRSTSPSFTRFDGQDANQTFSPREQSTQTTIFIVGQMTHGKSRSN